MQAPVTDTAVAGKIAGEETKPPEGCRPRRTKVYAEADFDDGSVKYWGPRWFACDSYATHTVDPDPLVIFLRVAGEQQPSPVLAIWTRMSVPHPNRRVTPADPGHPDGPTFRGWSDPGGARRVPR